MSGVQMTIGRYLNLLKTNRWLLAIPAALGFCFAVLLAISPEDEYEAYVILKVPQARPGGAFVANLVQYRANVMAVAQAEMTNQDTLRSIVEKFNLYPHLRRGEGGRNLQLAVRAMLRDLTILTRSSSQTIKVTYRYRGPDDAPRIAAEVANEVADVFEEKQNDLYKQMSRQVSNFLQAQEANLRTDVEVREAEFAQYKQKNSGKLPNEEDRGHNRETIENAKARIEEMRTRRSNVEEQLETHMIKTVEFEKRIRDAELGDPSGGVDYDFGLNQLRLQLQRWENELVQLRSRYSAESDIVRKHERLIEEQRKKVKEAEAKVAAAKDESTEKSARKISDADLLRLYLEMHMKRKTDLEKELVAIADGVAQEKATIADANVRLSWAAENEHRYRALETAVQDARATYNNHKAQARRAEAALRYNENEETEIKPVTIAQRAYEAIEPVGPRRMVMSITGLLLGLGIGIGLAWTRRRLDHSYHQTDDLRALLPGTVLITMPDVSAARIRFSKVFANFIFAAVLGVLVLGAAYVLGVRMGWWGSLSQIQPLLNLV